MRQILMIGLGLGLAGLVEWPVHGQITLGTQTKGILPVEQGGTNATTAGAARSNLGAVGLSDSQTLSNKILTSPRMNDIRGYTNSLITLLFGEAVGAVNYVGIYQAATGNGPLIQALGTDANVDLRLRPQGSGFLDLGAMTGIKISGCSSGDYPRIGGGGALTCDAGTASGAPTGASYITRTSEAGLSNETALDGLATGLLKNTAGVLSTAAGGDLPTHASRHNDGGADEIGIDGSQVVSGLVADARIPTSLAGRTFTTGVSVDGSGTDGQNFLRIDDSSGGPQPPCVTGSAVLYSSLGQLDYCNGFTMTRQAVGNVIMAGFSAGTVPYMSSASVIQSTTFGYATAATPDTFAVRDSQGVLKARQLSGAPTADSSAGIFQRYSSGQSNYILEIWREDTARMAGVDKDFNWVGNVIGNITGSAGTAAALTNDPGDCPATGFAYTINSAGTLGCRAVSLATADTTGQLAVSRLGVTGTPDSTKVLYGDRWAAPPSGGGNVSGPGPTTDGYFSRWAGTSGTSLGVGLAGASTTATANTVVLRDSTGATKSWDKGAQVHNVMAYGAVGDGVTDDRAAIQNAIDAETYGGVVTLPPGDFLLTTTHPSYSGCGLVIGNGTTSSYSSQNAITLQGSGGGVGEDFSIGNATRGATRIRSGTSSITKLICLEGPVVKVWLNDLLLDGGAYTANGIVFNHVAESGINRVNLRRFTTGWGMDFTAKAKTSGGWAFYTCGNKLTNFTIGEASNTGFSGIRLSGVYDSDAGPYHTSCSNVFDRFGVAFGSGSGAIGVELAYADNNKFYNGGFSSFSGGGPGSGKPVNFTQQSDGGSGTLFPYGNKFISIDSNHSQIYYGTSGTGRNFVLNHTESEGNADPNLTNLYWATDTGRMEIDAAGIGTKFLRGRAHTGTEIFALSRGAASTNGVDLDTYNDFRIRETGGGSPVTSFLFVANGVISPRATTLAFMGSPADGSYGYCSDCQVTSVSDNTCTSGGSGAFAFRRSGVWRCFATQN